MKKATELKSETQNTLKTASKTVIKGVTSFFGVDASSNDESLRELFESVDLSNHFIILEDLERSGLDVLEVLGYVNNLVEHEGVKLLIVANENEIIKYEYTGSDKNGNRQARPDEKSTQYLKKKEKTIGDTIQYQCDFNNAIKEIIDIFNNTYLAQFKNNECIEEILSIMAQKRNYNLRTFIFACQKTADIFDKLKKDDLEFNKNLFYSIIAFSMTIKNSIFHKWEGNGLISPYLGLYKYPLYRFCYNYIRWQEMEVSEADEALKAHKKMLFLDKQGSKDDPDLNTIYSFYLCSEAKVMEALSNIEKRLDNPMEIPLYDYSRLAFYLVSFHIFWGYNYSSCKKKMIRNITGRSFDVDEEILPIIKNINLNNYEEQPMYNAFINELNEALNVRNDKGFSYEPKDFKIIYDNISKNRTQYVRNHTFISRFELGKLVNMLFSCTAEQLQNFRNMMFLVYRPATKLEFSEEDIDFMQKLKSAINERIPKETNLDKIILLQFQWITENLDEFINNLS